MNSFRFDISNLSATKLHANKTNGLCSHNPFFYVINFLTFTKRTQKRTRFPNETELFWIITKSCGVFKIG